MKTVCFGEIMLRLCPPNYERFVQCSSFGAVYGGAEANVAVSLSCFGIESSYVTRLPEHEIGQAAINSLRRFGVDTSQIIRGGDRIGIYYLENGASVRPSKVIYDRAFSSISQAKRNDFDWEKILDSADCFMFTGITPALGGELPLICSDALDVCRKKGILTVCDINYRKNLWSAERAGEVMDSLLKKVDICISNEEHARILFGITSNETEDEAIYRDVAEKFSERFGFSKVVITHRRTKSASDNEIAALLYDAKTGESAFSRKYMLHIVDRIGGGDALAAGLIYCLSKSCTVREIIEFAVGASALKHTIPGDASAVTVKEVIDLISGDGSGRTVR